MLTQVRFQNTKKARNGNSRYVRCKLEDFTGAVECVMWPDDFARYKDEVHEDRICFVKAVVERTREEPGLVLNRVFSIDQARRELTRALVLGLVSGLHGENELENALSVLQRAPGSCPVFLQVRDAGGKRVNLRLGESYRINPATLAIEELEGVVGAGRVHFSGPGNGRNGGR
jgi:DNA polymerase-3 subunit alpha